GRSIMTFGPKIVSDRKSGSDPFSREIGVRPLLFGSLFPWRKLFSGNGAGNGSTGFRARVRNLASPGKRRQAPLRAVRAAMASASGARQLAATPAERLRPELARMGKGADAGLRRSRVAGSDRNSTTGSDPNSLRFPEIGL